MGPSQMLSRIAGFGTIVLVAAALAGPASADAAVEVPFATQFAINGHGGATVAANTLMTCPAAEGECLAARGGVGANLNNNNYAMQLVNVDKEEGRETPGVFDASTATLALPPGATVEFAGLYYGARLTRGTGGKEATNPGARGSLLLRTPGALVYSAVSAAISDSVGIKGAYAGFVDVTGQVAAAGSGEYTVANVQAGTGEDRYAGWSLVVAYADPAAPPRSVRIYTGLASIVAGEAPLQIGVTGLETPPAGSVTADVGLVAYEGDRGGTTNNDQLILAGKPLTDAVNPEKNIFNSTISIGGVDVATKRPNYTNQLGFDADLIDADGYLGNGATEAVLEESTKSEQYLTQAVAVAIELDPDALEPPVVEPPPVEPPPAPPAPPVVPAPIPTPPAPEAPTVPKKKEREKEEGGGGGGKGSGETAPKTEPAATEVTVVAPGAVERPTAVVPLRVTVASTGDEPVRGLTVCSRLSSGLTRLRAAGAEVTGAVACWKLPKLAAGADRTFLTTVRVDATDRASLIATTVVRAKNAPTRRRVSRIRVTPLPRSACGSSALLAGIRLTRRC